MFTEYANSLSKRRISTLRVSISARRQFTERGKGEAASGAASGDASGVASGGSRGAVGVEGDGVTVEGEHAGSRGGEDRMPYERLPAEVLGDGAGGGDVADNGGRHGMEGAAHKRPRKIDDEGGMEVWSSSGAGDCSLVNISARARLGLLEVGLSLVEKKYCE